MYRSTRLIAAGFTLAFVLPPCIAHAQSAAATREEAAMRAVHAAVIAGSVQGLVQQRAVIERALDAHPKSAWLNHYRGYALYREAMLRQAVRGADNTQLARLLAAAQDALEAAARLDPSIPETYALLAQVAGLQISLNPDAAMVKGEAAEAALTKALALGPANPRVALIQGINALYTPPDYGGGTAVARRHLNRAIQLFARDKPRGAAPSWGLAEAHGWIGVIHVRERDFNAARAAYARALEVEPNYAWIKVRLAPAMERMANTDSQKVAPAPARPRD